MTTLVESPDRSDEIFKKAILKLLFNILGTLALILAILGVFLPILPTTPFLLLASACYWRGSKRMHSWLLQAPVLGKILSDYQNHRVVPLRAKVTAIVLLWASMAFSIYKLQQWQMTIMLIAIGIAVTVFLLRLPSTPRSGSHD